LGKAERAILLTVALGVWLVLAQNLFFLVAAGATYRLFTKDLPAEPSPKTTVHFLAVMMLLGLDVA
jgi:ABC-type lipoprotein release transport system permease subunit